MSVSHTYVHTRTCMHKCAHTHAHHMHAHMHVHTHIPCYSTVVSIDSRTDVLGLFNLTLNLSQILPK